MPEIRVDVSDDVALLVEQLSPEQLNRIVTAALRERASEALLYDLADDILRESELTDERARELADDLKQRVANRHGDETVS